MKWNTITDPNTYQKYSIHSKAGSSILSSYVDYINGGGKQKRTYIHKHDQSKKEQEFRRLEEDRYWYKIKQIKQKNREFKRFMKEWFHKSNIDYRYLEKYANREVDDDLNRLLAHNIKNTPHFLGIGIFIKSLELFKENVLHRPLQAFLYLLTGILVFQQTGIGQMVSDRITDKEMQSIQDLQRTIYEELERSRQEILNEHISSGYSRLDLYSTYDWSHEKLFAYFGDE